MWFVPTPRPPLHFTEAQRKELRSLEAEGGAILPPRLRLRLTVMLALSEQRKPSQIVSETGISYQGLLGIRNRAIEPGIEALLTELRKAVRRSQERRQMVPKKRGRPPTPTLEVFAARQSLEKEAVIELVSIVIAADVQVAVLGVQNPMRENPEKPSDSVPNLQAGKDLQERVRAAILKAREKVQWTGFPFDQRQRTLFNYLRWQHEDALRLDVNYPSEGPQEPLTNRFSDQWSFFLFYSGKAAIAKPLIARLMGARTHESCHWKPENFCSYLEGVLHQIRMTCNIYGLCPTHQELTTCLVRGTGKVQPFEWHVTPKQIALCLHRRLAAFALLAHNGYLFANNHSLIRAIRKRDRISLKVAAPRPRALAIEKGETRAIVNFRVLPEFGYNLSVDPKLVRELEQKLRDPRRAPRFEYSVRLRSGQPTTSFPIAALASRRSKLERFPVALIGLPRQFLMPPLQIALSDLTKMVSAEGSAQATSLQIDGEDVQAFLFSSSAVIRGIQKAFERNEYGDSLAAMGRWNEELRKSNGSNDHPPFGWMYDLAVELPEMVPPFYFSDEELCGKNRSDETLRRLRLSPVPELASTPTGLKQRSESVVFPGYDRHASLERVYTDLDADFLLRKIDDETSKVLLRASNGFSRVGRDAIRRIYFPSADPPRKIFIRTIPKNFRNWDLIERYHDVFPSWAAEALMVFQPFPRILRLAVENAQHFVLNGHAPLAVAICTEMELLRSWKGYLGQFLVHKLKREAREQGIAFPAGRETLQTDTDEPWSEDEDVADVCMIIQGLWKEGCEPTLLSEFVDLSRDLGPNPWSESIERLIEAGVPREMMEWVKDSIALCRKSSERSGGIQRNLAQSLAQVWKRCAAAGA